jgi:hypothetical protein
MRKHFTLIVVAFIFAAIQLPAQVLNKGNKLFGGSFSFSVFNTNNSGPSYYTAGNAGLLPAYGWVIKNDLVLGVKGSVTFSHTKNVVSVSEKRVVNSFSFGPGVFIKKYKLLKNKFGLYFDHELNAYYNINKEKVTAQPDLKYHSSGGSYNFNPGVFYKFSENFFGEANIGGVYASYYGIGASFLQYFNLGINYRIPRKNS